MIDISAVFANYTGGPFPGFTGKNASGAGATDGTEFIAAMIDNWMWGWVQALLNHESITPNGVTESSSASQILDAIQAILPPGTVVEWNLNNDPGTLGYRFLLLNGQGILVANYSDLAANVYVGDSNNAAVAAGGGFYYKASDAAGTTPNIAGPYLILPESRGYAPRGLDLAASVDPGGASRYLGDVQLDAFQGHWLAEATGVTSPTIIGAASGAAFGAYLLTGGGGSAVTPIYVSDGVNGTPRTSSESRMTNRSTQYAIRF